MVRKHPKDEMVEVNVNEEEDECGLFCQLLDYRAVNPQNSLAQRPLSLKAC